jgi:hypothetical protein
MPTFYKKCEFFHIFLNKILICFFGKDLEKKTNSDFVLKKWKNSHFLQNLGIPSNSLKKYRKNKEKLWKIDCDLNRFELITTLVEIRRYTN